MLNASHPEPWGDEQRWLWKYARRPGFDPEIVRVLETDGRIVATWHAVLHEVVLGDVRLRVAFEGDTAVLPRYRGGFAVWRMFDELTAELRRRGAAVRVGSTTPELADGFYSATFGYLTLETPLYTKLVSVEPVRAALERIAGQATTARALRDASFSVQLDLDGLPPFHVQVRGGRVGVAEGRLDRPDIRLRGNQAPVLRALRDPRRGGGWGALIGAVTTGRVRVRVRWRALPRMLALAGRLWVARRSIKG